MVIRNDKTLPATKALTGCEGETGTAIYLLTEVVEKAGPSGTVRLQLRLDDATGGAMGFIWPEHRAAISLPELPAPVKVLAEVRLFDNKPQLHVRQMQELHADDVECAAALLPRRRCPDIANDSLDRLMALELDLPAPLNGFLRRVLLDRSIGIPLLRCRASVDHHHSSVGGLLVHCTEHLDLVAEHAERALPADLWAPHLARLGYLLHDIGKLRSVGEYRRGKYGLVVRHEILTIEMLAPHLGWLEGHNPELATGLRYVLAYLATPHWARSIPQYLIAEIVATVDHWSAAAYNDRDLGHLLTPRYHPSLKDVKAARAAYWDGFELELSHAS